MPERMVDEHLTIHTLRSPRVPCQLRKLAGKTANIMSFILLWHFGTPAHAASVAKCSPSLLSPASRFLCNSFITLL